MGCCTSRPDAVASPVIERLPSLVNLESYHKENHPTGIKLHVHSAGWQANAAFGDFHTVYSCDQYTFAALFDAHTATEVAEFCKRNCIHIFQECLEENAGDPRLALRSLFKELDASFFNSQAPPLTKAACGASGVAVYMDLFNQRCYVANLGTAHGVIGWATGSFNLKSCDGRLLTQDHSARDPLQQQLMKEEFPEEADIISYVDGKPLLKGVTKLTHCIGYGLGKDSTLAGYYNWVGARKVRPLPQPGKPYISNEAEVSVHDLSPQNEHILLISEGVLQQLSPVDASLFCTQFSYRNMGLLQRALLPAAAEQESKHGFINPAGALVRYTMVKAASNWRRKLNRNMQLSIEDMRKLQISGTVPRVASATSILRGDVHENISVIVLSLNWPRSRHGSTFAVTPSSMPTQVAYRWHLVLLFSKFMISRRRTLLKKWWRAVDGVMRKAREAAKLQHVRAWVDQGEGLHLTAGTVGASRIPKVPAGLELSKKYFSRSPTQIPSPPTGLPSVQTKKLHSSGSSSPALKHHTPNGEVGEGHPESPPSRLTEETLNLIALQATMRSSTRSTTPTPQTPTRSQGAGANARLPFSLDASS